MAPDEETPLIPSLVLSEEDIQNQMITLYQEEYEDGNSPISDFEPGSQKRNILASNSIEGGQVRWLIDLMLKMGLVNHAVRGWLDILGEDFGVLRYPPGYSSGALLFKYPIDEDADPLDIPTEPITVPENTYNAPSSDSSNEYETLEEAVIYPGSTVLVPAQCTIGGVDGDIGARKIDTITDENEDLIDLEVINPEPFVGGYEEEDDDSYRARIRLSKSATGKGVREWYESIAKTVQAIHDVVVVSMPYHVKYTVGLLVNGNVKPTSQTILNNVSNMFLLDENNIEGTLVSVRRPVYRPVNFKISITVKNEYKSIVEGNIKNDLKAFIEGGTTSKNQRYTGFNIGEVFDMTQIYTILQNIDFLTNFWVIIPDKVVFARSDEVLVLGTVELI